MAKSFFNEILEIFKQEAQLYQELLEMQTEKKIMIIENNLPGIEHVTKREQGFIKTIVQLEKERTIAVDNFCRDNKFPRIDRISELNGLLNPFEQQQLTVFENKLKKAITQVQEVTYVNEKLIEQSLEFIDMTITLAQSLGMQDAGYGKNAEGLEIKVKKNLFDVKV